jgi:carboxyl-terminal processing protease
MKREKTAWVVCLVLIGLLTLQLPGSLAQREEDYAFVRTLVDIHRQVEANYVDTVDSGKLREAAINGMLGELDPYSVYVPPAQQEAFDAAIEGSFQGVGLELNQLPTGQVEVVSPIENSPALKAGMMAGDVILKVNGESVEGMRLPDVIKRVKGKEGSEVKLRVRRVTGQELDFSLQRQQITVPTVKGYRRAMDGSWEWFASEDPKIAYIRVTQFTGETYGKLRAAISEASGKGMKGLIMDLRFNPGGRLESAGQILDMFIEKGVLVSTKGRSRPEDTLFATGKDVLPYFPMIVLINGSSASASEIVAGSLMDHKRAIVMGSRSYGKGSVQELVRLDQKSGELKLTVAYYYLPSGRLVHRKRDATDWGVVPQIAVPVDTATEQKVMRDRYEQELYRRPLLPGTAPATSPATSPSTAVVDQQLQRAVDTMVAILLLQNGKMEPIPGATQPSTGPSTRVVETN